MKVNIFRLEIPEEMLKSKKYEDFREDLFSFIKKWNLKSVISDEKNRVILLRGF